MRNRPGGMRATTSDVRRSGNSSVGTKGGTPAATSVRVGRPVMRPGKPSPTTGRRVILRVSPEDPGGGTAVLRRAAFIAAVLLSVADAPADAAAPPASARSAWHARGEAAF